MPKKIALYENETWQNDTPTSPGVSFIIPTGIKTPQNHPSFSKTNQSDMENTDINKIMARYEKSGMVEDLITGNLRQPFYGDFTNIGNYYEMRQITARTSQMFDALPANVRNRFDNDPQKLIDFVAENKKENHEEMLDLGLMTPDLFSELYPTPVAEEKPQDPVVPGPGPSASPTA